MIPQMADLPDFAGKCVSMSIVDDDSSHDLYDPRFEMQGYRLFIIGTVPPGSTSSDWVAGCQGAVAWERVTDYFVFDSLEAWTKAVAISTAQDDTDGDPTS